MIKTIIFDFGDVFINLDKAGAMKNALSLFELDVFPEELISINCLYEQGLIETQEFLDFYLDNFPKQSKDDILNAWNFILKDFPKDRLEFLKKLASSKDYKLILLSNTNELHINWVIDKVNFYDEFKSCFDKFYLSHEIHLRKPDPGIFKFVMNENKIIANETLFIDDTLENIQMASQLGLNTWHINEVSEDVSELFTIKKSLF